MVWARPGKQLSGEARAASAVSVQRCVQIDGAPALPTLPPEPGGVERLTPLVLVSILGGAGGAPLRLATNRGTRSSFLAPVAEPAGHAPPVLLQQVSRAGARVEPLVVSPAAMATSTGLGRPEALGLPVAAAVSDAPAELDPAVAVRVSASAEAAAASSRVGAALRQVAPARTWEAAQGEAAVVVPRPEEVTAVPPASPSEASAAVPPAFAAPQAPVAVPQAKQALFRKAALDAHYGVDTDLEALAEPRAGAWIVLMVLASLVAVLFVGAALLSIEVTVKAPGALRAPNGLRSVESVLSGAVTEVLARAGDEVVAQQIVVRLEDTKLRSSLTLRERELELLRQETLEATEADRSILQSATRALVRQQAAVRRRRDIGQDQLRQRQARLVSSRELVEQGAASVVDALQVTESVQAASQSVAELGSQLAQLELSLADRTREWQARDLERRASLSRASAAVEEAKSLLELVNIRSPAGGRIESLLATPGSVVQAGEIMAQVIPKDAPRSIVAFLPSRETAFVRLGTDANVEIESLPINEFGMARARVTRISTDIAKPEEIAAAFGEALPGSFVRVELTLSVDATHDKMAPHLRSGERVVVRLHRRERRIISLLFEFVQKWLGY
jgi:membrane fusion protein